MCADCFTKPAGPLDGSAAVLNVNDYALKTYVDALISSAGFNPFLLSGM